MDLIRVNPFLVYDHEQGLFMIYDETNHVRLLPKHFVSQVEIDQNDILLICNSKYHQETIRVSSDNTNVDFEQIDYILNEVQ